MAQEVKLKEEKKRLVFENKMIQNLYVAFWLGIITALCYSGATYLLLNANGWGWVVMGVAVLLTFVSRELKQLLYQK